MTVEAFNTFYKAGMLYLILGSIISADSNITKDEIQKNLGKVKDIQGFLNESDLTDEDKEYVKTSLKMLYLFFREI